MPRCVAYTIIAVAAIMAVSIVNLPELLIVPVILTHGAALLLDPGSLDFGRRASS